jgi:hypothetical protein
MQRRIINMRDACGIDGVAVMFTDGERVFFKHSVHYFDDNGAIVSGKITKLEAYGKQYDDVNGCWVEVRKLGKPTGEKRFFPFSKDIMPVTGDKVLTVDGIGVIAEGQGYSDFLRFGVKFDKIPERLECLAQAGYLKNGLIYYTDNEVDLLR